MLNRIVHAENVLKQKKNDQRQFCFCLEFKERSLSMDARTNAHQKPTANHYDNILIHIFINYHTLYYTCVYFF